MEYYTLEYSEKQGFFHYAHGELPKRNGYTIIARNLSYAKCNKFTGYIFDKYPYVNTGERDTPPFDTILNEFKEFFNP
jgi:hypothetical protein